MSDIGVMPTRTTLRITSTTGEHGTIPGATGSAAGCMTADQAQQLAAMWQAFETHVGGIPIQIDAPRALDGVSRSELQQIVNRLSQQIQARPPPVIQHIPAPAPAVADAITVPTDVTLPPEVVTRIAELEQQVATYDQRLATIIAVVDQLMQRLEHDEERLGFVETHGIAKVEISETQN